MGGRSSKRWVAKGHTGQEGDNISHWNNLIVDLVRCQGGKRGGRGRGRRRHTL